MGRDTCAAVTLGAALVGARSTTGVMAVLPADHVIPDAKKFQQVLGDAFDMAAQGQAIVTIGIKPTEPATGYGYIHTGAELPTPPGAKKTKTTFFKAERFVEKPNFETALEYVNSGQYRWNAGMFVWSFITVTNGLEKHQPEMFAACQRWFKVANNPAKLAKVLAKEYPDIKKISIDYALMEKAQNVIVADGAFEWDDLGAWNALARHLKAGCGRQLRRGGFHPRGRRAEHHLRRADQKQNADCRGRFARFDFGADRRRGAAGAQIAGAEGQGIGQETRRGYAVEEVGLAADEHGLTTPVFPPKLLPVKPDDILTALQDFTRCERVEFLPLAETRKPSPYPPIEKYLQDLQRSKPETAAEDLLSALWKDVIGV